MYLRPPKPIVTLTTDFGLADPFVGIMKGVILTIAPQVSIVDISHAVTPFRVIEAAYEIEPAWRYFPKGSIHVVVCDPGVGSDRRALLVEAGGHYFVGPDNGTFTLIYREKHKVREITNAKLGLPHPSRTFHGRDVFAPAAAHLAHGVRPAQFGKPISDPQTLRDLDPHKLARSWRGQVIKADRFGNLVTNFHVHQFPDVRTEPIAIRIGRKTMRRFALTYTDGEPGELLILIGSSGFLEIAAREASAQLLLRAPFGTPVDLEIG
jgi:S-adenosylmethionine hydrolase